MLNKTILALLLITGLSGIAHAQVSTNSAILEKAARGYRILENNSYTRALSLAKQKGWPLTIPGRNRSVSVLMGVDAFDLPLYYITNNNTTAAATTRASQLWPGGASGLNLNGSSDNMTRKLGVWDGGRPLDSHVELTGRITHREAATVSYDDHSTHTTGTMIASGVNPNAKGMAYGLKGIIAYDFSNDISEMTTEAAAGLLVSNHSYSYVAGWNYNNNDSRWEFLGRFGENEDYKFGYYSKQTKQLDSVAYNAPFYLVVKSAGNSRTENGPAVGQPYFRYNSSGTMAAAGNRPDGISSNDSYGSISLDCNAKNILTVGAVQGITSGYSRPADVVMTNFSSWGPTDDGRIKPDVVADGVNVLSSIATSTTSYAAYSGTSMASPNAAGSLFLLQEYYSKLKNNTSAFMRAATLKGLAIHTAEESGTSPGPDYSYGWGLLNVEKAAAVMTEAIPKGNSNTSAHLLYENVLNNTDATSFTTTVISSGKEPLKATISWTDVPGDVDEVNVLNNPAKKLVNDLDIRITKGSSTYRPWTLDPASPSLPAVPGDNITDNVERIDVDSTVPGQTYTITVTRKKALVNGSQAYSLLVSGVGGTAYCTSAPGSSAGARIDSVSFKNIHFSNPAGNTTYTDNTNLVASIEPSQSQPISIKVNSSDGTTASKMVKVFIDYNNNGLFTDAGENVATSGVLSNGNIYTANFTTPSNLTLGSIYLMRVIVEETTTDTDITPCGTYGKGETQDYRVRVVAPSTDIALTDILTPGSIDCADTQQYLTVRIKNNGTVSQSNIPVTATVKNGSTTIATLNGTFKNAIAPLSSENFTLQTPFSTVAGTTYTITATATLTGDQLLSNNTINGTIVIGSKPSGPAATGEICGNNALLKVTSPVAGSNYFWYTSPTATSPFANGSSATTATITSDKTYYVGTEAEAYIGPTTKMAFDSGGYNNFSGNFIRFNNSVPLILESVRLYTGNPGTIKFTVGNLGTVDATKGTFNYTVLSTTTLTVPATSPTPKPAPIDPATNSTQEVPGNDPADTGAIYYLNLPVTQTGDHILIVQCDQNGATIFRNRNITGTTYPISVPGIMSITGNSVDLFNSNPNPPASAYYYFLYNLKVNTGACVSDRTAVVAGTVTTPVISQVGDSLSSNVSSGIQWYVEDIAIAGATNAKYKPTQSGTYKVIATDALGCQKTSNSIQVAITAIPPEVLAREIKLSVSPNPNNGVFNLSFEVANKADLGIDIFNAAGQKVYTRSYPGFSGRFSGQVQLHSISSEFYILKIQHDKKTYVQKILIQR